MFVGWVGLFQKASITCWSSGERVAGAFALVFLVALLGGIFFAQQYLEYENRDSKSCENWWNVKLIENALVDHTELPLSHIIGALCTG